MSHYCCKRCGQRYDDCRCHTDIVVKDFSIEQSFNRAELEDKIQKQYEEIKELASSLGINLK